MNLGVGCAITLACIVGCAQAPRHSPSYDDGYNLMTNDARQIIAEVNDQLRREGKAPTDSPAQLLGPHGEYIASTCEGYVEARITSGNSGRRGTTPLPDDFNSHDFLDGCRAAGQDLLRSGT